ncbi:hypothetical protein O1K_04476 [Xanthomonas fragariae LMG 25863]|nr:hypothetical protein O1K_04476 [Xanthomonas fragariae LMG 25863]
MTDMNRRKFRRSTGKLLDTLGQAAESLVHVFQHFRFSTMCTQRFFGTKVGQPLPMQAAQLVKLRPENLEIAAGTKRLVGVDPTVVSPAAISDHGRSSRVFMATSNWPYRLMCCKLPLWTG